MLVREVMSHPAVTVHADDGVRHAAAVLLKHRIASAPVVDDDGHLVGVISEADLLRGRTQPDPRAHLVPPSADLADEEPAPGSVADVMTSRPLAVHAGADAADAARLLLDHGIKAVRVLEGRRVVGVVARRDLLRTLARPDDAVRDDVVRLLDDLALGDDWDVGVEDGVVALHGPHGAGQQRVAAVVVRTVPGVVRVVHLAGDASLDERPSRDAGSASAGAASTRPS